MAPKEVITVLGATGSQGGSVVDALLKQGKFAVRAVTRNAAKAQKLGELESVEVVEADMDDKASLVKAFKGAAGGFIVTDFYGVGSFEGELRQGMAAVDAAKEAGVGHVVYSALEDPRKVLPKGAMAELPSHPGHLISHFESKAEILEYLKASGVPYTALLTSIFFDNFIKFWQYQRQPDGSRTWSDNMGTRPLAAHSVVDIGGSAAEVFADPEKYKGKVVTVAREEISWPQAADIITEVTGITVKYVQISDEDYAKLPFPAAEDLAAMFKYYRLFPDQYAALRKLEDAIFTGPDFRTWATENREALITALNK